MALYKRYIPPKPSAASGSAPQTAAVPTPAPPIKAPPKPIQHEGPQKRKRERTDEEVAERKAKKLRKKGIDPTTVDLSPQGTEQQAAGASLEKDATLKAGGITNAASTGPAASATGSFAHVKDKKKRHKLEKEARKARIAAEKEAKADGVHARQDEEVPVDDGVVEEALNDELPQAAGAEEDVALPSQRKTRRKDRNHDLADTDAADESRTEEVKVNGDNEQVPSGIGDREAVMDAQVEPPRYDATRSQPKKRRHKLEAVLKESNEDLPLVDEVETDHLKKHGNIIGKFQKSQKLVENTASTTEKDDRQLQTPAVVLRDLVPLPQPDKAPTPEFRPDPNALPPWLAKPTVIADDGKCTFAELGLEARLVQHLSKLGFDNALPVQQALIPLLLAPGTAGARYLPWTESVVPDIAVGAPTGSGKTIAYLLPIIEALKTIAGSGKLKALIVVPTRELVMQVAAVAESLAKGSRVKVGVATGTGGFGDEQARLIRRARRHDAKKYQVLMANARRFNQPTSVDGGVDVALSKEDTHEDFESYLDEIESLDVKEQQLIRDALSELTDHIPTYESAVDILVATPGRLLEHLDNTLGFDLAHLEWLVLDEADKLLDGQYSNFLQVITPELQRPHSEEDQDARERYLRTKGRWKEDMERRVRKVVLSATMTRDISKLMDLRLRRPQMVLVRGKDQAEQQVDGQDGEAEDSFELPSTLREYSVHAGDGSEKPLFLLHVLKGHVLPGSNEVKSSGKRTSSVSRHSDTDSSSDSSDSEDLSDSSSDTSSVSDSDNEANAANGKDDAVVSAPANHASIHPTRASALDLEPTAPTVLIFTSSTESASRLSHLLSTLLSSIEQTSSILTLTSTTTSKALNKQLSTIPSDQAVLAITTDRAARGLDALGSRSVTHVVQYDVPRSATNYVHRVGRTARAGRAGEAWALFTHSEAKWFVGEVVRGGALKRGGGGGVEKVKVRVEDEGMREEFRQAVEGLRGEVLGGGGKGKKGRK